MPEHRSGKHSFKPRARLLLLLGDQLIRDAGIAIFEFVKKRLRCRRHYGHRFNE